MKEVLSVLQTGVILTTPIFFLVTLLVLWRILRALDDILAVVVHVKRQIEIVGRGGRPDGIRPTPEVRGAERQFHPDLE